MRALVLIITALGALGCSLALDPGPFLTRDEIDASVDELDASLDFDARVDFDAEPAVDARDAGPCGTECTGSTPVCDEPSGDCVQCVDDGDCEGSTPRCDEPSRSCVQCVDNDDCAGSPQTPTCVENACAGCGDNGDCVDPAASRCEVDTCAACTANDDCTHLPGLPACALGACVECTPETESAHCGGNSCDPATLRCTGTVIGTTGPCGACVTDSECGADYRCVPMRFMGAPREGGFCLKSASTGCFAPFRERVYRTSLSGAPDYYCGVREDLTTCEAVLSFYSACTTHADCGAASLIDGRCEIVAGVSNRCTFPCQGNSECPGGSSCGGFADGWCR